MNDKDFLLHLQRARKRSPVKIVVPESEFPEVVVTVPDKWPYIQLAPFFDVHMGHGRHDDVLFQRHLAWFRRTPYTLGFNGGDMIENASKLSVGAGVYEQKINPEHQLIQAIEQLNGVSHKFLFALPGNHEARTAILGHSVSAWLAMALGMTHFPDYVMCYLKWRGNTFRILAHHGSGASVTAGAQRMAARKDISWARPFDIFWCFPPGTPVLMADGTHKDIAELQAGDEVISGRTGKPTCIAEMHDFPFDGELVALRPVGWPEQILATPNHELLCTRQYSHKAYGPAEWVRAEHVVYGDAWYRVRPQWPHTEPDVSPDRMRLYGYYLAEGSAWSSKVRTGYGNPQDQLVFAFHKDETDLIDDCAALLADMNFCRKIGDRGPHKVSVSVQRHNAAIVRLCSREAVVFFGTMFGVGSENKRIPAEMMGYPEEHVRQLLKGLYDGDGHRRKGRDQLTTTSPQLASQVMALRARLGEYASMTSRLREGKKRSYDIGTQIDNRQRRRKYRCDANGFASYIRWARRVPYTGKVYCPTMTGNDHTFVVGMQTVSNTGHLHNPLVDVLYQTDVDMETGRLAERNALVIISPSYLKFFGTYGATKRYHPGTRGMAVVTLQEDGRLDASIHARGKRR